MSDEASTFPNGWTCPGCGEFIGWNTEHRCPGSMRASAMARPGSRLNPIVVVLERIAKALEGPR